MNIQEIQEQFNNGHQYVALHDKEFPMEEIDYFVVNKYLEAKYNIPFTFEDHWDGEGYETEFVSYDLISNKVVFKLNIIPEFSNVKDDTYYIIEELDLLITATPVMNEDSIQFAKLFLHLRLHNIGKFIKRDDVIHTPFK